MASFGSTITRDGTGTVRRREITLTTREKQIYGQLWAAADKDNSGFITGADAVPFFAKSGLPPQVLGQIWVLADSDNKGVLGQQGFSIAVKLIAHAQSGKTPSAALINVDAPLPHFEGITPAKPGDSSQTPIATQLTGSGSASGAEPPLTNDDRTKYGGMFVACGPVNGLLDGDKAREVFLKSKLPVEKLSQIWSLADTKQRGSLDITDFTIAMYYIQHTMDGSIASLPTTLPASILKACSVGGGGMSGAGLISSPVMGAQTLPRQLTGGNLNVHSSPGFVGRQLTGSLGMTSSPLAKQNTGGAGSSSNLFGASDNVPWDISPEEKAKFDRFFDQLDKNGTGVVGGEEASRFFMNSRLPESVLAQIWDLSDITGSGNLSKDEFAVAMLLINRKNATNAPIPKTLPLSLVPPSLRSRVSTGGAFASQEPTRSLTMPSSQSQYRRQSFDLLGDGPSLTSTINAAGISASSQADKDLMGAEDLTSKLTSETGELASMQNQINNLSQVTGDLQAKRAILEKQLSVLSAQKQDISIRLNQIKTLHDGETKAIRDLESTLSSIQPQLIKLREEYAVSERELNIARSNKDEFMLTLAKDQEESNMIRARLRQNNEETIKLREELEAKKKDTGRQKGLLEIARRQLSASDADKQKIVNEIAQESEKAAQAAKEIQALSTLSPASASSLAPSGPPPPPAPRGSRKEPPPPPASRGTGVASPSSSFASRVSPEAEEAFGIPPALRSPTGSFHSVHSPRPPQPLSRQSTGSSPFETVPRQTTGSSPFQTISRQATGSSFSGAALEPIAHQGTGMSSKSVEQSNTFLTAPASGAAALQENLWSPSTHAAHANMAGQPELTSSPFPETPQVPAESLTAAAESLPTSPPAGSQDPFGSMAFPAMDTPPVTKMDFDSAFTGFATSSSSKPPLSKNNSAVGSDGVKSAEAFAEAFPDIDGVSDGTDASKAKRVSAFGFDDDFSAASPFTQTLEKSKEAEEDEFPPIVEMEHPDEDSSSDDDDDDAFVQATSSVTSPDPAAPAASAAATNEEATAPVELVSQAEDVPALPEATSSESTLAPATTVPPVSSGSVTKKLTAADFGEFEAAFGGSGDGDDFDSAFNGVELVAPKKVSSGTSGFGVSVGGFDEGFDFNSSFDDAFGPSTGTASSAAATTGAGNATDAFGASFSAPFPSTTAPARQESFGDMEFNTSGKPVVARQATALDLDEAFGGFGGSTAAPATGAEAAGNGFGGFGDFEAEFSSLSTSGAAPTATATTTTAGVTDAAPGNATTAAAAATTPAPPQVDLPGVEELISMGFTRQQANDALSRYDTVERAANFLLEGGQ
ncbi:hypothetical protein EC968_007807 [Mortierella alpina]|nr:hypothetical protein EC968_007807 [Mortierella alpina]